MQAAPILQDDRPLLPCRNRPLLMAAVMMVSICQFLDATIANVALPHMQAALGASSDSISWVLTSFIIANAIATPITGWLSGRIGSRNLFMLSTVAFLGASALCGAATSLSMMVVCRTLQGAAAAFIGPMTQTIMFDVNPPSKHAQTLSSFGMIVMVAPISGPFLGGLLTDNLSWRWIYYVNLPIGIPALILLWFLLPSRPRESKPLDRFGFTALALGLGALQLVFDRGQHEDWFNSREIVIEAMIAVIAFWTFAVHTATTRKPLFGRELYADVNFLVGGGFMMVLGLTNISLSATLPVMYQTVYHYPVMFAGLLMAPRGFGVIITSLMTNRLMHRLDYRYMICIGYLIAAFSIWSMTRWTADMDWRPILFSGFVQGLGLGMVFAPMNLVAFARLKPEFRPDGSGLLGLFRNLGGSMGVSVIFTMLARNQQINHATLSSHVWTGNLPFDMAQWNSPGGSAIGSISGEISRQAQMIAYLDNFVAIAWLLLFIAPLPLLLRKGPLVPAQSAMPVE